MRSDTQSCPCLQQKRIENNDTTAGQKSKAAEMIFLSRAVIIGVNHLWAFLVVHFLSHPERV